MPRYRFRWEQLPGALARRLARDLQLTGDPVAALREGYGARPGDDFVRDAWPFLRGAWLAKDGARRRSVVALLRERRLGHMELSVGNRQEQLDYLASCRNSFSLRQVVLEEFRVYGSAADTSVGTGAVDRADRADRADRVDRVDLDDRADRVDLDEPEDPATGRPGARVIRSGPPEFDLDKRLAMAWVQMRSRLTAALSGLANDETMNIVLPSAYDEDDLEGAIPYLQFIGFDDGAVRAEVSSNHFLDERHRLSDAQGQALLQLGWGAPASNPDEDDNSSPNFWIDAEPEALAELAEAAVGAIRDVFGVPHPSFLIATGLDGDPTGPAELLGLPRPVLDEPSPVDDEPLAVQPADRDHLIELVDAALVPVFGGLPVHDDDGNIPIRSGSAMVFVRVDADGPYVELFSPILVGVRGSPLALERISQLNRWVRFVSFGWDGGTVHASMHLYCRPFVPKHLRHAVAVLTSVADRLDDELRLGLGGRAFFGEDEASGTDEAPSSPAKDGGAADDEELPEALLTLLQLDAEGTGAVSAEDAADICGRNRRDILHYIRTAEEQVIEWRSSAEEALGDGDREEAAACAHEGKAWQSTVDLLRSALRLVARN